MSLVVIQCQRGDQRFFQFQKFGWGQVTGVVSEDRFGQAHERVAMDTAVVAQTLGNSYRDLGGEAVVTCVDGGTQDSGKPGINQRIAADDDEIAKLSGIVAGRFGDPSDFTPFHRAIW